MMRMWDHFNMINKNQSITLIILRESNNLELLGKLFWKGGIKIYLMIEFKINFNNETLW